MFIEMAIQFNSPLRQINNYFSLVPLGAINSDCRQAVWPGTKSTVTVSLETLSAAERLLLWVLTYIGPNVLSRHKTV